MGRKIPAKKHRGVKDPLEQQAKRLQSLKSKINAPPTDPDEQPVPRSLTRLFGFQQRDKAKPQRRKVKQPQVTQRPKDSGVSKLRRAAGESARDFSLRINSAVRALSGANIDYPMDTEASDYKGARMAAQKERRERKRQKALKAAKGKGMEDDEAPKLSRAKRRTLRLKEKKLKLLERRRPQSDPLVSVERVSFGDVTHAPPALSAPRRAQVQDGAARPGRRDLLLTRLLTGAPAGTSPGAPDRKGPDARAPEQARLDAVAAYRAIKQNLHRDDKKTLIL